MKKLITILIFILSIGLVSALDECKGTVNPDEVPCAVLLPVNTTLTNCNTINISFYSNTTLLESHFMTTLNPFMCDGNFTQTDLGTYAIQYSTGDSGSITVEEQINNRYFLYVISLVVFFIMLGIGYYIQDELFLILAGMLSIVLALNLFVNGFPGLTNTFLQNSMIIVLAGIGFYYVLVPSVELIERWGESGE